MADKKNDKENIIAGFYEHKGGFHAMPLNDFSFERLQKVTANSEKGGQLVFFQRTKPKTKDTDPDAFLVYRTKEQVDEFRAKAKDIKGL